MNTFAANAANAAKEAIQGQPDTFLSRALPLIARGIPVIPLRPKTKIAIEANWPQLATTDVVKIEAWQQQYPDANCGAVALARADGKWFWETDSPEAVERMERETGHKLPDTLQVQSSQGKGHNYFNQSPASLAMGNLAQGYLIGGDHSVRVSNQYVVAPKSVHPRTGLPYEVISDAPIIDAPDWLIEWLVSQKIEKPKLAVAPSESSGKIELVPDAPVLEGGRNSRIASNAGTLWEQGKSQPEIEQAMLDLNTKWFRPPLDDEEVRATVASICRYEQGKPHKLLIDGKEVGSYQNDVDDGNDYIPGPELLKLAIGKSAPLAAPTVEPVVTAEIQVLLDQPDADVEASIPPFDPSVINGIYAKFVDVVTRGTSLQPQFVYAVAKTIVGIKMAGKVTLETIDVEPRLYAALIGKTGSGKGAAFRRIRKILEPEGAIYNAAIKISNSFDSGAGLKELFFAPPADQPVLGFIDEICDLGNKSQEARNPGIIDTMITLADGTSITRSLAKGTKTKNDARLCMVMCGQSGLAYTKALAGRTQMGLWDRFYPEYGVPQETGDMPPINPSDAMNLLTELNSLDYSGTIKMAPESKKRMDDFWKNLPEDVRKTARWKNFFQLDAYLSAFGRGVRVVEAGDIEIAIKIFTRQLIIRKACFTTEIPDRTGYYLSLLKRITERMIALLKKGVHPDLVAKSHRDYEKETHAHRDNETHYFAKAWQVHAPIWLQTHKVKKSNGQEYAKFLPREDDELIRTI